MSPPSSDPFSKLLICSGSLGAALGKWTHAYSLYTHGHVYIKTKTHPATEPFSLLFGGLNETPDSNKSDQTSKTLNATDTHNLSLL